MFKNIKAVIFDLDGTIYHGNELIDGALEVISHTEKAGKQIYYLTNNSTKTRMQIVERLCNMGIQCEYENVYTSGYAAVYYAQKEKLNNIYIFGSDDLKNEFEQAGLQVVNEEKAENLFIGFDAKIDYEKLTKAFRVAKKANKIIAANIDRYYPGEKGMLFPGCGAMVSTIEYTANRTADFIVGKPNTFILDIITHVNGLTADEVLVVGDVYESDIAMANKKGSPSVLVGKEKYDDTCCISQIKEIIPLIKMN